MKNNMTPTKRDLATILAALRFWQDEMRDGPGACYREHFNGTTPLGREEIDTLCDALNLSCTTTPDQPTTLVVKHISGRCLKKPVVEVCYQEDGDIHIRVDDEDDPVFWLGLVIGLEPRRKPA